MPKSPLLNGYAEPSIRTGERIMASNLIETLKEISDMAARDRIAARYFFKTYAAVPDLVAKMNAREYTSAWLSHRYGGSLNISICRLDGFKGNDLLDILFEVESTFNVELAMEDQPAQSRKVFTAHKTADFGTFDIQISAELKYDSQACKRVQIGTDTKTVEVPIYRLDCEGEAA